MKNHGVVAVIVNDGKFLLLEDSRELMLGFWAPPHGRCDPKDKSEMDTVIREVFEETHLTVKPLRKLWTTEADTKLKTVSFWLANVIDGVLELDKRESSRFGWFTLDESFGLKLYPGTKRFFELVKKREIQL